MADAVRPVPGAPPPDPGARRSLAEGELAGSRQKGTGVTKWSVAALVLLIVVAVVLAQNTTRTTLHLLFWRIDAPLFAVLLVVGLGFAVLTELGTVVWRHRRRSRP